MSEDVLIFSVKVSSRAAIMAGKTAVGVRKLSVSPQDLAGLSAELREELALAYEAAEVLGEPPDPPLSEPTFAALVPVLQARAHQRGLRRTDEIRSQARRDEETAAEQRKVASKEQTRQKALRAWVEKHGDDDQRARMREGFLPEDEILESVADELLDLRGLEAYTPMFKGDVCECGCAGAVTFTAGPPRYLDGYQYQRLQEIRETATATAMVEPIEHRGACPRCKCVPLARITARVTLAWEGWSLVREFLLK